MAAMIHKKWTANPIPAKSKTAKSTQQDDHLEPLFL
jgi:hypothetical protein